MSNCYRRCEYHVKIRIQGLNQSNTSYLLLVVELTWVTFSSDPNLRIQILHNLTHKMQIGIQVAYNVCEVKPDKINH